MSGFPEIHASMTALAYDRVRVYHQQHGDDYGSEASRALKYRAVKGLLPAVAGKTLLDVGCGQRRFQRLVRQAVYTGIDLVEGTNVLDVEDHYDLVVANGVIYKLSDERAAKRLLYHCWTLADEAFVFTSKDAWGHVHAEELSLDCEETFRWARKLAGPGRVRLDAGYMAGDFCIGMYR